MAAHFVINFIADWTTPDRPPRDSEIIFKPVITVTKTSYVDQPALRRMTDPADHMPTDLERAAWIRRGGRR